MLNPAKINTINLQFFNNENNRVGKIALSLRYTKKSCGHNIKIKNKLYSYIKIIALIKFK